MSSISSSSFDDVRAGERVRAALLCLYDPLALAATALAVDLSERGIARSPRTLYELLVGGIEQLKPIEPAPPQSHGWRCYRYLLLRYVECRSHATIAQDLGISPRQASRIHQDALQALARIILPAPPAALGPSPARERGPRASVPLTARHSAPRTPLSLEAELATVGHQPPEGDVDLSDVTRSVCDTFRRLAAAHRVRVEPHLSDGLPAVRINRVALRQIELNLLTYLLERVGAGSDETEPTIALRAQSTDQEVTLTIAWQGSPGSAEPGPTPAGSTSLLAAARYLAQYQGATIEESGDGRSSLALSLRLPAGDARTILVVDDNPDVGELFRRMLARNGYHVVQVRTASRAIDSVRQNPPDAIILDVVMPAQDGWEVLTALQGDPRLAAIPVVVCSVLPDRELALSLGAADFLAKPVTRSALLRTLADLFQRFPAEAC